MPPHIRDIRKHIGHAPLFINAAAAIIADAQGKIVLQLRGGPGEADDQWSLPGGLMEVGERASDTAVREAKEETGLDIALLDFVGVYSTPELVRYPNGDECHMITQIFSARITGGTLTADGNETRRLAFFELDSRPILFRPHLERALTDFAAGRRGVSD